PHLRSDNPIVDCHRKSTKTKEMSLWTRLFFPSPSKFFAAVRKGDMEKVKALLEAGPDLVFNTDNDGWTALMNAAHWGHKDVAELLLANKAEVNSRAKSGLTALHCAAAQGFTEIVKLLLANGAEVNAMDNDGITPLHFAAEEGRKDLVELLLSS